MKGLYNVHGHMYTGSQSKAFERRHECNESAADRTTHQARDATTARLATPHTARLKPAGH